MASDGVLGFLLVLTAFFCPPWAAVCGVIIEGRNYDSGESYLVQMTLTIGISVCLTMLFWVPGVIYAFLLLSGPECRFGQGWKDKNRTIRSAFCADGII